MGTDMDMEIKEQIFRFGEAMGRLNRLYEGYARTLEHTYYSLYTLYFIFCREDCTQTDICRQLFLPKQTVHSVILSFSRQGYVEMVSGKEDRRRKMIRLTPKGKNYADKILTKITGAEMQSMERLGRKEGEQMLRYMEQYVNIFEEQFQKGNEELSGLFCGHSLPV